MFWEGGSARISSRQQSDGASSQECEPVAAAAPQALLTAHSIHNEFKQIKKAPGSYYYQVQIQ
jgi:hypothetical protein